MCENTYPPAPPKKQDVARVRSGMRAKQWKAVGL